MTLPISVDHLSASSIVNFRQLALAIKEQAKKLGFDEVGITDTDLGKHAEYLERWLGKGFHGELDYMAKHGTKRGQPDLLVPGTMRIISVRLNYWPPEAKSIKTLRDRRKAYISRYALGRDYHKVLKQRLRQLITFMRTQVSTDHYRIFVDSAPVLEKAIAQKAGLGWIGKNTLLLNQKAGSYFFLGEIFTNIPLPIDAPVATTHCGNCQLCMTVCPTQAIVAPYQLDARRCISYLTIEYKGSIAEELRPLMGNRIFGCDDCQLVCPWNRFAKITTIKDFTPRRQWQDRDLIDLFAWTEAEFLQHTEGSPLRRTGYVSWLRNLAIALGNAPSQPAIIDALKTREHFDNEIVQGHVAWALGRHTNKNYLKLLSS